MQSCGSGLEPLGRRCGQQPHVSVLKTVAETQTGSHWAPPHHVTLDSTFLQAAASDEPAAFGGRSQPSGCSI